jgi:fibronectin type 3 domain-containing protein
VQGLSFIRFFHISSLILLGFSIISCGIKAPPLPPEEFAPEKITDLEVYTKNNDIVLKWSIPTRRADDTRLLDLAGFEIYRKEQENTEEGSYISLCCSVPVDKQIDYSLEAYEEELSDILDEPNLTRENSGVDKEEHDAQDAEIKDPTDFINLSLYQTADEELTGYERIEHILLGRMVNAEVVEDDYIIYKDRVTPEDPERSKSDKAYSYLVISFDRKGLASQPSNIVHIGTSSGPNPPTNFVAVRDEGKVWLSWSPPQENVDGTPITELYGFNIYRKGAQDSDYSLYPLNDELIKENSYVDLGVKNGETYVYEVRPVTTDYPPWHEGPASNEVAVTIRDTYPPGAPQELVGISKGNAIVLNWNPNSETDLLGYHVYRKSSSGKHYQQITTSPLSKTTFRDQNISPDQIYFYVITALDDASPPNESPFSVSVQVFPIKKE